MLNLKLERSLGNCYGLYDRSVVPFDGDEYATILGKIMLDDQEIGHVTMYAVDCESDLSNAAYSMPGDIGVITDTLCGNNGRLKPEYAMEGELVIVDNIYIEPEHRNKGYGSLIMNHLHIMLNDAYEHNVVMLALYASVYDIDELEEKSLECLDANAARLVKFYERAGFQHIENNVMVKRKD